MSATVIDETKQRHWWSRRLFLGVGVLVLVSVAVVYSGSFLQTRVGFPGCSRSLDIDGSTTQTGQGSMRWVPPGERCAYPSDDAAGLSAYQETHFAFVGVAVMGMFAVALMYFVALGLVPDP